jgi:glycerol dehydrogenase-like iron-containing ADH family enzyme
MFESIDVEKQFNKWVRDYILIQNLLCHITDWVGSAPASGSEHLFAHTIEKYHQDSVPIHGELVALGVIIFSSLHSLNQKNIIKLLDKFSIPRSLSEIGVTKENVVNALMDSKQYGNIKSRYTIVEELNYNRKDWELLISSLIEDKYILI